MSKNNWSEITVSLARFNKSFLTQMDMLTKQFDELSELQQSSDLKDDLTVSLNQLKETFRNSLNEILENIGTAHESEYELVLDRRGSREILSDALDKTQESLIVVCPWLTIWGVTESELEKFKKLLEKGVSISIGWGRTGDLKRPKNLNSLWYNALPQLFELERIYPLKFHLKAIGTHEKFLVCDDKFAVLGSHNILTSSKEIGDREIGIFTNSPQIIEDLISRFQEARAIEVKPITEISIDKKISKEEIRVVADECGVSENDINNFIDGLFELEDHERDEFLTNSSNSSIIDHFIEEAEKYPSGDGEDVDISYLEPEHELLSSQEKSIHCTRFNPHSNTLATCGYEQGIEIWDTTTGTLNQTLGEPSQSVSSLEFDFTGERLVSDGKNTINVWDLNTHTLVLSIKAGLREVTSVTLSPNGQVVAATGHRNIKLWNSNTGELLQKIKVDSSWVHSIKFSPDGEMLCSVSAGANDGCDNRRIKLWNWKSSHLIQTFIPTHTHNEAWEYAIDDSWQIIVTGGWLGEDRTIKVWNLYTGELVSSLCAEGSAFQGGITSLAFTSDNKILASGGKLGRIKLWNLCTNELVCTLNGHFNPSAKFPIWVQSLAFSPDDSKLASSGSDGVTKVWKVSDLLSE